MTRLPPGALIAVAGQSGVVLANLGAGVFLARGLALPDRGLVALLNLLTSILGLVGALGYPELVLRLPQVPRLSGAARTALVLTIALIGVVASSLLLWLTPITTISAILFVLVVALSSQNAIAMAVLFKRRSLKYVSGVQAGFAIANVSGCALLYFAGTMSIKAVVTVWLFSEAAIAVSCWILSRGGSRPEVTDEIDIRALYRLGGPHCFAQLTTGLSDRSMVVVASIFGGLSTTAIMAVAQSVSNSLLLPVQGLTPAILAESSRARRGRYTTLAFAATLAMALPALYFFPAYVIPFYGPYYGVLVDESWLLIVAGILLCGWRLNNLYLRGVGRASTTVLLDVAVILTLAVLTASSPFELQPESVAIFLLLFSGLGFVLTAVVRHMALRGGVGGLDKSHLHLSSGNIE